MTTNIKTYQLESKSGLVSCAPYTSYFGLFRDSAKEAVVQDWENFTADSVKNYFDYGFSVFTNELQVLKDTSTPSKEGHAEKLMFMLESLIHARELLDSSA